MMCRTAEVGHSVILTDEQRRLFPVAARLEDARRHCQEAHGATRGDYRMNVWGWHRRHAPECERKI